MSVNTLNVTMWKKSMGAMDWLTAIFRWARQDSDLRPSDYELGLGLTIQYIWCIIV